jgi:hypothetical protein
MAYAPDLGVAFLCGEGVHGWWDKKTGRYMDDLWAYDASAHRWICVYPGADVNNLDLKLNADGVEVTKDGDEPLPVAQMGHAYEGTTYDTDLRRFMFMPCPADYWDKALGQRRKAWLGKKSNENAKDCSPWIYDVRTAKWDRRATGGPAPRGTFGDVLVYVPTLKKTFLRTRGSDVWWYDASRNAWNRVKPAGPPPPFGIDPTACYDSRRDRIYVGGGSYPVADGPHAFWIYDVKTDTWIDPKPTGKPCGGSNSYNTNNSTMTYDAANDRVVINRHKGKPEEIGMWVYDPTNNAWEERARAFPDEKAWRGQVNAFYDRELNVHVYHVAGDSELGGVVRVYRVKGKLAG